MGKRTFTGLAWFGKRAVASRETTSPPIRRDDAAVPAKKKEGSTDIDQFLNQVAQTRRRRSSGGGRLLFAMDATGSRQDSWQHARRVQGEMFAEAAALGGLQIQLCYYGGWSCKTSKWLTDADTLLRHMRAVECRAGTTQIGRVLDHARREAERAPIDAMVFVGDCCEEDSDDLAGRAEALAPLHVPVFTFQEGNNPYAETVFSTVAEITGGASCRFDGSSPAQLRDLLRGVAAYAAGGHAALEDLGKKEGGALLRLTHALNTRDR